MDQDAFEWNWEFEMMKQIAGRSPYKKFCNKNVKQLVNLEGGKSLFFNNIDKNDCISFLKL